MSQQVTSRIPIHRTLARDKFFRRTRPAAVSSVTLPTRSPRQPEKVQQSIDRAIGCERCHGPGGNHVAAVSLRFADLAIAAEPSRASPSAIFNMCDQCHSPRGTMSITPDDPFSVRFQATTLTWSRCYSASSEAIGCLTCHDPHRDARPDTAFYERKCLGCHDSASKKIEALVRICPVNPSRDCIKCHMPLVTSTRIPHSPFTDHNIRVHLDFRPDGRRRPGTRQRARSSQLM